MTRGGRILRSLATSALALLGAFGLLYVWMPWEYEVFPKTPPKPSERIDPDFVRLFSRGTKVAIITAHPDDPEFYVGGLLTRLGESGASVSLILCTDGDKAYYPFEDYETNRRVRQSEQREASARYGATDLAFLGFPDGRLHANPELVEAIRRELERIQPNYILAFDPDYARRIRHRDHRLAGVASLAAARAMGFGGWSLLFSTRAPNAFVDITDQWEEKRKLLATHRSQFFAERLEGIERMVGRTALDHGRLAGTERAEGIRAIRLSP